MLDNIGLVNMNGRVYDPGIGRFLSVDPLVSDPTNSQGYNPYSYVGNSPLTHIDPSGYAEDEPHNYGGDNSDDDPGDNGAGQFDGWQPCSDPLCTQTVVGSRLSPLSWSNQFRLLGISILTERLAAAGISFPGPLQAQGNQDQNQKTPCPSNTTSLSDYFSSANWNNYWSNVNQNLTRTNVELPGLFAPTGSGLITSGAMSQTLWGTNAFTAGRWAFSGFGGATMGGATFTSLETGILVGATAGVNFVATGAAFEIGASAGSMISAIPTGEGNTVASLLGNVLYKAFGPSSSYDTSTCGP